jgi:TolB protein
MRRAILPVMAVLTLLLVACASPAGAPVATQTRLPERQRPEGPLVFQDSIAFVSDLAGNYDVYVLTGDGEPDRLTESEGDEGFPAWSPDGSQIAFGRREGNGTIDLWVMEADGSGQRRVYDSGSVFQDGVAWHPDGEIIYLARGYFDGPGNMGLKIIAVSVDGPETQSGVGVERLWDRHFTYTGPAVTERGRRVAFGHYEGYALPFRQDIYVGNLSADGMVARRILQLTEEEGGDVNPSWSPDGSAIAWAHQTDRDSENHDVWVMNSDGSEKRQVTSEPGKEMEPVWSSDGLAVYYVSDQEGLFQLYMRYAWGDEEVLTLTKGDANIRNPSVRPVP